MKNITRTLLGFTALVLSLQCFADSNDTNLDLIHARQSNMELRSYFLGPLAAMAKGKLPYDAEMAAKLSNSLQLLNGLDMGRAWAPGTANDKYEGKTTALPKIWDTYPEIGQYGEKYVTAVDALASTAGNSLNELRASLGDVGKACKACHDDFTEKQ
ncbi:c-type cytochrome [Dasania marina]|uniref:c-type cytochrome n=1 Tax=Dasania marina TaxID=471499 RepID=UPI00037CA30F|nr:cytochrome c [Dasania marina]